MLKEYIEENIISKVLRTNILLGTDKTSLIEYIRNIDQMMEKLSKSINREKSEKITFQDIGKATEKVYSSNLSKAIESISTFESEIGKTQEINNETQNRKEK